MIRFNCNLDALFPTEVRLNPFMRAGVRWDPSKPPSLMAAEMQFNAIKNRTQFKRDLERANRQLEVLNRQRRALDGVPPNAGNERLKSNSVTEAQATVNRLRASENRAPKLTSGSLAEAEGILAQIKAHGEACDQLIRQGEVNHARNELGRLGLYLTR